MPKIAITGIPGLDGEYELEMVFTHRDFRTIKQVAGVRANEVMDAIEAGDLDIIVALAEIALRRAGRAHTIDDLWDSEAGNISLDVTDEEVASPPTQPAVEPRSDGGSESSGNGSNGFTDTSLETSSPLSSGTRLPEVSSEPQTLTT